MPGIFFYRKDSSSAGHYLHNLLAVLYCTDITILTTKNGGGAQLFCGFSLTYPEIATALTTLFPTATFYQEQKNEFVIVLAKKTLDDLINRHFGTLLTQLQNRWLNKNILEKICGNSSRLYCGLRLSELGSVFLAHHSADGTDLAEFALGLLYQPSREECIEVTALDGPILQPMPSYDYIGITDWRKFATLTLPTNLQQLAEKLQKNVSTSQSTTSYEEKKPDDAKVQVTMAAAKTNSFWSIRSSDQLQTLISLFQKANPRFSAKFCDECAQSHNALEEKQLHKNYSCTIC